MNLRSSSATDPLAPAARQRYLEAIRRLLLSLFLSVFFVLVFTLLFSTEPEQARKGFFLKPFASTHTLLSMIENTAPPVIAALGVLIAFKAGHFVLGGEGQLYAGIIGAAWIGMNTSAGVVGFTLAIIAGIMAGSLLALPSALSKRYFNTDVLLSSFLLSQAFLHIGDWLIAGPLRDNTNNLVASMPIPKASLLSRLFPPSIISQAPFIAAALVIAVYIFLARTRTGTKLGLFGKNPRFAANMAFPVGALAFWPIVTAGAFHGLAGSLLALGINGRAIRGMSAGIGWNAIGICLIAGNEPLGVPLAALLFAWLDTGSRQAAIISDLPADTAMIIKALVIIAATARPIMARMRRRNERF